MLKQFDAVPFGMQVSIVSQVIQRPAVAPAPVPSPAPSAKPVEVASGDNATPEEEILGVH